MVEKVLRILVDDSDIDALEMELRQLGGSFDDVERKSNKLDSSIDDVGKKSKTIESLDRLTGGWASSLVDAYKGLKNVVAGLNLTKAALISTGVGAIVVALASIVAYWEDIRNYMFDINDELEDQLSLTRDINLALERRKQSEKDILGFIDSQTKADVLRAKVAGATEDEITNIQRRGLEERIDALRKFAEESDELLKKANFADDDSYKAAIEAQKKAYDELGEARANLAIFDLEQQLPEKEGGSRGDQTPNLSKITGITGEALDAERERLSEHFDATFDLEKERLSALQDLNDGFNTGYLQSLDERLQREKAIQAASKEVAMRNAYARREAAWIAADAFASASDLIGQKTEEGKFLAAASTLISTYLSAQQAYQSQSSIPVVGPYLGAAAAAAAVLSGLANVKAIYAVKVPGQGGGGGGSSGSGVPATPPAFNVIGNSPENQLNQSLIERNNEPVKAFVTEGEVSSAQEMERNKVSDSSFG
jgi:hypothetical protein